MITFFIPGVPRSTQTGSVMRVGRRLIPSRRGSAWSTACGLVARRFAPREPLDGPLVVTLQFLLPRPKRPRAYPRRPDLGNASKGVLDAFNGVLWVDDSQITRLVEQKEYASGQSGLVVSVERL